ncbi:glycosyltransferase family 4 protein [Orrella sp. NBD-18]|uniref:Glycosyltransferase family 4 protein n=1 Tax=Sheuella amnicola TaxID=2707330 RepID=A0A6B2R840_9BURK|nr:glycosyltransferase family 4 protein [Sheuella amnicola]NDY83465.1 glycosyltransferase family 4 protein [Sheuella amnicola]
MNILLVTDSYPPEIRSASHLMLELAQELKCRDHRVTVITTWPEYNLDQDQALRDFKEFETEDGINVIRVKTLPHHNVNYLVRGLSQLLMPVQFLLKLRKYKIKPDAVVVYSPPLPLALVGSWLRRKGVRNLLNVQDLFPQNAIDLGILTSKMQIKFFQAIERYAYRTADVVTVHSDGNRKMVLQQHPELGSKLRLLHNWVDIDHHSHEDESSSRTQVDFRQKWGIKQKHVAVFAGVMGPSQYLELILGVAERLQDQNDLLFLLVGDGKEKEKLQALAKDKNLNNIQFEGFISRDVYPDLLKACSIGLVCLSPQNKTPVVPGKILGHMASGLPVVAFLHTASDGHAMIADAKCGVSANSADWEDCAEVLRALMQRSDEFESIGLSGKKYATEHFSKEVCVSQLEAMIL